MIMSSPAIIPSFKEVDYSTSGTGHFKIG